MFYKEPDADPVPYPTPQTRPGSPEMIGMDYHAGDFEVQESLDGMEQLKANHRRRHPKVEYKCKACENLSNVMYRVGARYTTAVPARCPCFCASLGLMIAGIISGVGLGVMPPEIETNFDSFMKTDANVSITRDAFINALQARSDDSRRLNSHGSYLYHAFNIYLAFELKEGAGQSMFDVATLKKILKTEKGLLGLSEWQKVCDSTDERFRHLCNPGLSAASHAFPSVTLDSDSSVVPTQLSFDGGGRDELLQAATIDLLHRLDLSRIVLPLDFDGQALENTRELRTAFHFKIFCCEATESALEISRKSKLIIQNWKDFLEQTVLPHMQKLAEDDPALPVLVFYDGDDFDTVEVLDELWGDVRLAGASMGFVLLYVILHTGSIFLGIFGLITIFLAVPLSYTIFQLIAGTGTKLTIASFLSLFLVIGLGSDVIFVITDVWKDSAQSKDRLEARLRWTLFHAGKASLATTVTTALSFFANLISVLRPLREFGMFMGLAVVLVWLLAIFIYAPLCIVDEFWFGRCSLHRCIRAPHLTATNGKKTSARAACLGTLADRIHPCRWFCVAVFVLMAIAAGVISCLAAKVDSNVPQIFPAAHNRNKGMKVFDRFEQLDEIMRLEYRGPPTTANVCKVTDYLSIDCTLRWCSALDTTYFSLPDKETCSCVRKPEDACGPAKRAVVKQRYIGLETITQQQLNGVLSEQILRGQGNSLSIASLSQYKMSPIILQDWATGTAMLKPVTDVVVILERNNFNAATSCGWEELCFCRTYHCELPAGWQVQPDFVLQPSRRLQVTPLVPPNMRAVVDVVFGLQVEHHSPLLGTLDEKESWRFADEFDLERPWTQRNLYAFCTDLPEELRVIHKACWIEEFRDWIVKRRREKYPVPHALLVERVQQFMGMGFSGEMLAKDFVWIRDGKIRATFMTFTVDVHKNKNYDQALDYKELWDKYVAQWNTVASQYELRAWHTSMLWVKAEAQKELVQSTVKTLIFVVVMAFLSMLLFTLDLLLSIFVVLATVEVISGLTFFIVVIMGWAIGPIEVIALIVFVGYAVTYSLHIAHKYSSDEASIVEPLRSELEESQAIRFQRTRFALRSIGGAAIGSAVTTIGCSIFLLFCTLIVFQRLGAVVLLVTTMSIITAMAPLPSFLFVAGPMTPGRCSCSDCCFCRCRRCSCCCRARKRSHGNGTTATKSGSRKPASLRQASSASGVPAAPVSSKANVPSSQGTLTHLVVQSSNIKANVQGMGQFQMQQNGVLRL